MIPSIEQEIRDLHELLGSSRDPEGRAFVPLADAYRRSGDPARALELLRRGTERHPSLAAGHLVMAWTFRDLADDAGAESAFREVLALDRDNARALVGLGRLVENKDDVGEAERLVQRGLALDPRLASEGTPDRVPRHSSNPEVVGAEALAPLEWEVIEPAPAPEAAPDVDATSAAEASAPESVAEPPLAAEAEPSAPEAIAEPPLAAEPQASAPESIAEPAPAEPEAAATAPADEPHQAVPACAEEPEFDEHPDVAIVDAADLAPDPVEEEADLAPDSVGDAAALVPLEDAEAALLASLEPDPGLPATEWSDDGIDIEWEVEGFYQALPEAASDEEPSVDAVDSAAGVDEPTDGVPDTVGDGALVGDASVDEPVADESEVDESAVAEAAAEASVADAPLDETPVADAAVADAAVADAAVADAAVADAAVADAAVADADAEVDVEPFDETPVGDGLSLDTVDEEGGGDVDRFIEALSAARPDEEVGAGVDPVLDPWTLEAEDASSGEHPVEAAEGVEGVIDLAALAPDDEIEIAGPDAAVEAVPESGPGVEATDDDLVLPTRTLGDLYAKQGLTGEAIKVYEELVAREPSNASLAERLEALRDEWNGGGRSASKATPARGLPAIELPEDDDEPAVLGFFDELLGWEPRGSDGSGA